MGGGERPPILNQRKGGGGHVYSIASTDKADLDAKTLLGPVIQRAKGKPGTRLREGKKKKALHDEGENPCSKELEVDSSFFLN